MTLRFYARFYASFYASFASELSIQVGTFAGSTRAAGTARARFAIRVCGRHVNIDRRSEPQRSHCVPRVGESKACQIEEAFAKQKERKKLIKKEKW